MVIKVVCMNILKYNIFAFSVDCHYVKINVMYYFFPDNVRHGKDLVLGKTKTRELQLNNPMEVPFKLLNTNRITHSKIEPDSNKMSRANNPANSPLNKDKAIITKTPSHTANEDHAKTFKSKIRAFDHSKVKPEIELKLKRVRVAKDSGKAIHIESNVLRHSDVSAFSRSKWYKIGVCYVLIILCPILRYGFPTITNWND